MMEKFSAPLEAECMYVVDNTDLKSRSRGIVYRNSMNWTDKSGAVAEFGSRVSGTPCSGSWLRVGDSYLPFQVNGKSVLVPVEEYSADEEEDDEKDVLREMTDLHGMPDKFLKVIAACQYTKKEPEMCAIMDIESHWYEVVYDKAIVRTHPRQDSLVEDIKMKGEAVELFEWDHFHEWRRWRGPKGSTQSGWMRINHPDFGPLLKPIARMYLAVKNNNIPALKAALSGASQKELKVNGNEALKLAAERGYLDCCAALMMKGCDPDSILSGNKHDMADYEAAYALAAAIMLLPFEERDFDAALQQMRSSETKKDLRDFIDEVRQLSAAGKQLPWEELAEYVEEIPEAPGPEKELEPEAKPEASAQPTRSGELYQVVNERGVAIRNHPDVKSSIIGTRKKDEVLELHARDPTGVFREVFVKETNTYGWVIVQREGKAPFLVPYTNVNENFEDDEDDEPEEPRREFINDWSQLPKHGGR